MGAFAYYRQPYAEEFHVVRPDEGDPLVLDSLRELNDLSGFVVAPFSVGTDCPVVVIRGEVSLRSQGAKESGSQDNSSWSVECEVGSENSSWSVECEVGSENSSTAESNLTPHFTLHTPRKETLLTSHSTRHTPRKETLHTPQKGDYPFALFHDALLEGRFRKLVLARTQRVAVGCQQEAEALFMEACRRYPRMFVTLFSTPQTGTWLMATPETLLQSDKVTKEQSGKVTKEQGNKVFTTMALAGTMRLEGEQLAFDNPDRSRVQDIRWSQKNIQEQRLVATYIADTLKGLADDISERGPYTTRAANLVHLRSDFAFTPKTGVGIGDLVAALHPTPAVCGLPKEEARAFILENEPMSRRYYSGFCGPLNMEGETALYVSLRCMELRSDHCQLYAGGGLLADSVEEQEWQETEAKLETMRGLLLV